MVGIAVAAILPDLKATEAKKVAGELRLAAGGCRCDVGEAWLAGKGKAKFRTAIRQTNPLAPARPSPRP